MESPLCSTSCWVDLVTISARSRSRNDPPLTLKHLRADLAYRTYEQVWAELLRRHGWRMSVARVQQICATAEAKLRKRLAEVFDER